MTRLTRKLPGKEGHEGYVVEKEKIINTPEGYSGEAVEKLARFENFYDELVASQEEISRELEMLRNEGKEKSVRFRELFGKKLMNNNTLIMLKYYKI
ncbi:hypothetical protein EAL2_808p00900 (plasmid) [Peptoclostridium acidaminophilum DSM 3953]|uniref:Uncharacterized protein n=1 Tax=Peptoclostridium acidaminophilum DSM 3953 TaxID=1286171 RepID=W8U9S0_PEPAC|nr:hypothetical protein [Peptoclostridium acidaminophilum]AHM57596.1 hypothetical protein EAL2_808p00900 [Peptoclostridium acidaminophilum DSM 3953]